MKKEQILVIGGGLVLLLVIYFLGTTVPAKKEAAATTPAVAQSFDIQAVIKGATAKLPERQQTYVSGLSEAVVRGDVKEQQIRTYRQLAQFWSDSAKAFIPFAYYTSQAAKLENSEKSLTFAAQLLLDNLRGVDQPDIKTWLAGESKELFEKAIVLNPKSDSLQIGLGSTYIFGAPADNPQELMKGIQQILAVSRKDSTNLYAQKMLGIGGIISGQYDKAVERLEKVAIATPHDLEVLLMLAEGYERLGDKAKAISWYEHAAEHVENAALKTELNKRIQQLR
ncbi:tetratricopeptide repeat protein [Flavihumibacter fluvii]|uniref:tetratricopeptide repeat protein n=1 Tax=Flavihumibacter fluvii TaxID=2838157 RepID=UPI001BDE224B|nr:tetratricopeptide repeat protein [Flavihumibacter fluvii]ULQ51251.1 tetratricopeptide repeat protein [Flavihumibacter fluvii]